MSIALRLLLSFFLAALLPLLLLGYFASSEGMAMLRTEALQRLSVLADKKVQQIGAYLEERVGEVRLLARHPEITRIMPALLGVYGRGYDSAAYRQLAQGLDGIFARISQGYEHFHDAFLISRQGEVIYTFRHEADFATNLINGPYRNSSLAQAFREARMTLEGLCSSFEFYPPSGKPAAFIAFPLMRNGEFVGVLALQLNIDRIQEVVADRTGLGKTGETILAVRSDAQHVMYLLVPRHRQHGWEPWRPVERAMIPPPVLEALDGGSGSAVTGEAQGSGEVAAWRYLPRLDAGMLIRMDAEEVFNPLRRLWMEGFGVLALLGLVSAAVALYFGRQISGPLNGLVRTATEIAGGRLGRRASEDAPGELGTLARAFNRMAEHLQALYRSLEDRIEARTRELSVANKQLQGEIVERTLAESNLRKARQALEQQQALLKDAQRLGRVGSWEQDIPGGQISCSEELYRLCEVDPADFKPSQRRFLRMVHQDDRKRLIAFHRALLRAGGAGEMAYRLCMPDGRIRWVHEYARCDSDADGNPVRLVAAVQDITDRKAAEDALRIAAVAFETHDAIMITDAQANILRVNRAFTSITGFTEDEVRGKNPRILRSGHHDQAFYAGMWQRLLGEGVWEGEIWDRRRNGEIYPKWLTITAVKNAVGETTGYVAVFSDITARKKAEEEIRNLAFYDALTGLPNRRLFLDRFRRAQSVSARTGQWGALLLIDMDRFKLLNDTLGHDYGDLMLIEVGRRIRSCVREVDTAARLGGDEFVVLIEELDRDKLETVRKAALITEKIRDVLARPYDLKGHGFHSTPSIGVSFYCGSDEPLDTLMKQADMAMYQAKEKGRNQVCFFDPQMQQAVERRAWLEAGLRNALLHDRLRLYYQVQVDSARRPIGAEALIRWEDPVQGLITPDEFIAVVEESSLIREIGTWVLETACHQLAQWAQDEHLRHLELAVNVCAQQFELEGWIDQLQAAMARHGVPCGRLKLELTESALLRDRDAVVAKMHAIKAIGIRLSLDDFGTGYSSLSYLRQLPLDEVKIDQSFVHDLPANPDDVVMVRAIIDLARNFGLGVVAEGVETEAQWAILKQHGCPAYQGYLFGKPVPQAEFEEQVRRLLR